MKKLLRYCCSLGLCCLGGWASSAIAGSVGADGTYQTRFEYVRHFSENVAAYQRQMQNKQALAELDELAWDGRKKVQNGRLESAYLLEYFSARAATQRPEWMFILSDLGFRIKLSKKNSTCLPSEQFAWETREGILGFGDAFSLANKAGFPELLNSTLYKSARQEATCFSKLVRDYTQAGAPSCVPVEQVQACLSERPLATMYPLEAAK